jgi:hypothetical protein
MLGLVMKSFFSPEAPKNKEPCRNLALLNTRLCRVRLVAQAEAYDTGNTATPQIPWLGAEIVLFVWGRAVQRTVSGMPPV